MVRIIKEIFTKEFIFDLEEIKKLVRNDIITDDILIFRALEKMMTEKTKIFDMYNRIGYLDYKGGFYIFQPLITKNITGNYRNRTRPLTKKIKKIKITPFINTIDLSNTINNDSNLTDIYPRLKEIETELLEIIDQERKIIPNDRLLLKESIAEILSNYRYSVDWLISKDKEILLNHIISKVIKDGIDKLTKFEKQLYRQLNYNILFMNRDIKYGQSKYKDDDSIWGYKLAMPK